MNYRKVAVLLLAVGVVFAVASLLSAAEPRKSHRPLPGSPGMFDENELAQRLQAAQDLSLLRALADKMLKDPKNFNLNDKKKQQLLEKLLKDQNVRDLLKDKDKTDEIQRAFRDALNNPNLTPEQLEALRKQFEKISPEKRNELLKEIEQNPGRFNLDKKDVEELKKLVEQAANGKVSEQTEKKWAEIFNKLSQNRNLPSGEIDIEALKQALPRLAPPGPEAPREPPPIEDFVPLTPPKPADAKPNTPDASMPPEPPSDSPENTTETLLRLADWVQDIDPDDELVGRMADLLRDVANGDGFDNSWAMETLGKGSDLIGWLAREDWLPTEQTKVAGSWFENLSKTPGMVSMPSTPSIPSVSGGLPSVSATFESEHLARIFIWAVLLLLLGGAALWIFLRYRGLNRSKDDLAASWPVRPGDVATRGDLVRAFEYLALLLLGVHAKHWHHLDLGKRLGDSSPNAAEERRRAANQLAHLYELARYAPEDELLPESDLAAARRDLSFLAGAGAA